MEGGRERNDGGIWGGASIRLAHAKHGTLPDRQPLHLEFAARKQTYTPCLATLGLHMEGASGLRMLWEWLPCSAERVLCAQCISSETQPSKEPSVWQDALQPREVYAVRVKNRLDLLNTQLARPRLL